MTQPIVIPWKKGDSFIAQCQYLDVNEQPVDFIPLGITVKSQVRTKDGVLVSELVFTYDADGAYQLHDYDTTDWPLGRLQWDIQYMQGSVVFSTETVYIALSRDGATL